MTLEAQIQKVKLDRLALAGYRAKLAARRAIFEKANYELIEDEKQATSDLAASEAELRGMTLAAYAATTPRNIKIILLGNGRYNHVLRRSNRRDRAELAGMLAYHHSVPGGNIMPIGGGGSGV